MPTVFIADVKQRPLLDSLDALFQAFGGIAKVIPAGLPVSIKPNAIHFTPHVYTDPALVEALLAYLRDHGYTRLELMENATGGNFTRLIFHVIGYTRLCRRYGAKPVYLDEGPVTEVRLRDEDEPTRLPKRLVRDFIEGRGSKFYLDLPKLKTHSMATVTLGVKNQQAFPIHADRMQRHNAATLHKRLAAIYDLIRPDFCIVEGIQAVINGHCPPAALLPECLVPLGVLVGGPDTLAVDVVAARLLGYELREVEHLRLCAQWGLGQGDLKQIDVQGLPLARFTERYAHTLLGRFHPDVRIVQGREMACKEGCKGNSLAILEMLTNDFPSKGGWTLVFGKGIDAAQLEDAPGDILVVGPCAVQELRPWLVERFSKRRVFFVDACNDLMSNVSYQARLMGVTPLQMSAANPLVSGWLLALAKLHHTTARIPPIFG